MQGPPVIVLLVKLFLYILLYFLPIYKVQLPHSFWTIFGDPAIVPESAYLFLLVYQQWTKWAFYDNREMPLKKAKSFSSAYLHWWAEAPPPFLCTRRKRAESPPPLFAPGVSRMARLSA